MSKNARNKRRAKARHRREFMPWFGADLENLITMIDPHETPFLSFIEALARHG